MRFRTCLKCGSGPTRLPWMAIVIISLVLSLVPYGLGQAEKTQGPLVNSPMLVIQLGHNLGISFAVLSRDGQRILTASEDPTARLWDVATGKELRQFIGHEEWIISATFAPDGDRILTASEDKTARLWEVATGKELQRFTGHGGLVYTAVFTPDGRRVLTASEDKIVLSDVATGKELRQFNGQGSEVRSAIIDPDGERVLTTSSDGIVHLWDMATGKELRQFTGRDNKVFSAVFAPDGHNVLTANSDHTARLWEVATGKELQQFTGHGGSVYTAVFTPDGRRVLTASEDKTARLWEIATGKELQRFTGHGRSVWSAVFTPDGKRVLTASDDHTARLWEVATGKELRQFKGHGSEVRSAIFDPDGERVLTVGFDHTARLWEVATGKELQRFTGHSHGFASAVFTPDGKRVLTACGDGSVRLWETATGQELQRLTGHTAGVNSAVFARNGKMVLTASSDRTVRLWETATEKELARLISFTDGMWAVTTPDGRFDTNNLEEIKGLHWIMPDDPLRPLSLEIFMRDYYEPRLLPRVLAKEQFFPLPSLVTLNRAQPKVDIQKIQVVEGKTGVVTVSVEVTSDQTEVTREGKQVTMQSGAFDLRLFRNGQLVGQFPDPKDEQTSGEQTREQELAQWRQRHEIHLDPVTGKKIVTFHGVRLPRQAAVQEVEFTAYAFNVDRVKSTTARRKFEVPKGMIPRQGRAYVVTVGINGFESDLMNRLSYAANDAKRLSAELSDRLKAVKDPDSGKPVFGEANVVSLALVTEFGAGEQAGQLTVNHATKYRIKAVIDKLAGKPSDAALLKDIAHAEQLQLAQPEDLVVLAFSTHGDTDQQGQFYLMPYDLGTSTESSDIRKHAISSDELSGWLRSMDAGEMVMIVDACHSAGAVESQEFKPGPMGSRGLGQLAFDKGMRILAASQRDQYALETDKTQQGLLSYALVREGLREQAADFQPKDGRIQLAEWLNYGVTRVPGLYQDYRTGKLKARAATPLDQREGKRFISIQEPALFDFARGRDMSLVSGVGR